MSHEKFKNCIDPCNDCAPAVQRKGKSQTQVPIPQNGIFTFGIDWDNHSKNIITSGRAGSIYLWTAKAKLLKNFHYQVNEQS